MPPSMRLFAYHGPLLTTAVDKKTAETGNAYSRLFQNLYNSNHGIEIKISWNVVDNISSHGLSSLPLLLELL